MVKQHLMGLRDIRAALGISAVEGHEIGILSERGSEGFTAPFVPTLQHLLKQGRNGVHILVLGLGGHILFLLCDKILVTIRFAL